MKKTLRAIATWVACKGLVMQAICVLPMAMMGTALLAEVSEALCSLLTDGNFGIALFGTMALPVSASVIKGKSSQKWAMAQKLAALFAKNRVTTQLAIAGGISYGVTLALSCAAFYVHQLIVEDFHFAVTCLAVLMLATLRIRRIWNTTAAHADAADVGTEPDSECEVELA